MAMIDGDSYDPPPSSDGDSQHVISDLQQMNLESNEIEVPSPIKVFVSIWIVYIIKLDGNQF